MTFLKKIPLIELSIFTLLYPELCYNHFNYNGFVLHLDAIRRACLIIVHSEWPKRVLAIQSAKGLRYSIKTRENMVIKLAWEQLYRSSVENQELQLLMP